MSDYRKQEQDLSVWADETWEKIEQKMQALTKRNVGKIPAKAKNGRYDDCGKDQIHWWTNGFWPGMNWMLYMGTGDPSYRDAAILTEEQLDAALYDFDGLHHDVGFLWLLSSGIHYELLKEEKAKSRLLTAASILAARYNLKGRYIRAWNGGEETAGWVIIDCMMNIPLLYRASEITGDPRFRYVAENHAETTMKYHVRPDGSVKHIVEFDPRTGEYIREHKGQGYGEGSSWSRGQGWGLYGFVLSYLYTGRIEFLDTAKRIAHYFIASVAEDYLPRADFRAPENPEVYDASAGAVAACGLLELAKVVPEYEKKLYLEAARKLLWALEKNFCNWNEKEDGILEMCSGRYGDEDGCRHISLIYGDFYFIEAVFKLKKFGKLLW